MTATANKQDRNCIKDLLGLKDCKEVIGNSDRTNVFYQKIFRHGNDMESSKSILKPIAKKLLKEKIKYPITVIYLPLKLCGFAYTLFEYVLGDSQYYPEGSSKIPENRLFAQFHASQTKLMKEQILRQVCSMESRVRVIFATIAMGMGVDIPSIRQIVHIGPPCSIKAYFQETGRAGRDGKPAQALLYYNNKDIAKNRAGMTEEMRMFYRSVSCLRVQMLKALDFDNSRPIFVATCV